MHVWGLPGLYKETPSQKITEWIPAQRINTIMRTQVLAFRAPAPMQKLVMKVLAYNPSAVDKAGFQGRTGQTAWAK